MQPKTTGMVERFINTKGIGSSVTFFHRNNILSQKATAGQFKSTFFPTSLVALASRHPQSCSATEVKGGCTCSQVSSISAACCKKFNSMNILQHCPSDFVAEPTHGHTRATFWSHNPYNIRKKCVASKVKMSQMQPRLMYLNCSCKRVATGWIALYNNSGAIT